jgi:murein DD-endopeptidase
MVVPGKRPTCVTAAGERPSVPCPAPSRTSLPWPPSTAASSRRAEASAVAAPDKGFALSSIGTLSNHEDSQNNPVITDTEIAGPAGTGQAPAGHGRHRRRGFRRLLLSRRRLARIAAPLALLAAAAMLFTIGPLAPGHASASNTPRRLSALWWAEHQAGKWYCYGGTGPSCFDCSGLVKSAYRHAGVRLPRTTYEMLHSRRLVRIPASKRRRGDLAFYGTGHVEMVTWHGTYGATTTGERIGWHHPSRWWHPTMYFRLRW